MTAQATGDRLTSGSDRQDRRGVAVVSTDLSDLDACGVRNALERPLVGKPLRDGSPESNVQL